MINVIRRLMGREVKLSERQQAKMAEMQARADAQIAASGPPPDLGGLLRQAVASARDSFAEMFDAREGIIDPGDAEWGRAPEQQEDAAERARTLAADRAARDAARAPYRAEAAPAVVFTRIPTTGAEQLG